MLYKCITCNDVIIRVAESAQFKEPEVQGWLGAQQSTVYVYRAS